MKKRIVLILCILLLAGCAPATYDGPTMEKSVVSEFIREHHQIFTGRVDTERTVYAYDIYGNIAQTLEYLNGAETAKTIFTYDDRGNLLTKTRYSLGGWFPRRGNSVTYTYDDQNRIISEVYDQATTNKIEYIFDDEARTCTRLEDSVVVLVITYDESGQELSRQEFAGDSWSLTAYTRDDKGQVLTNHTTDSNGNDYLIKIEYDDHGNRTFHETIKNGIRTTRRYSREYDDLGRPLREFEIRDGIPMETLRWEYLDEKGSYCLWRGGIRSYIRRYDDLGNEIESSHYANETDQFGIREFTVYRTIQVPAKEETP